MSETSERQLPKIGFIGLGAMGGGMVDNLLGAGFEVVGFDLREQALARLEGQGGRRAKSPADAARQADLLILMVVNNCSSAMTVLFRPCRREQRWLCAAPYRPLLQEPLAIAWLSVISNFWMRR